VLPLLAGVAMLVWFGLWERRSAAPILPLGVFRSARFSATNAVTFVLYAAIGGAMFLLPIQLQQVAGYPPLASGLAMLPVTVILLALSAPSGALAARIGPGVQLAVGPVIVAAGLALFARIDSDGGYLAQVLPAVVVFALGIATTVAPLTTTAMASAPPEHAGVASAINNDVARTANLIAVAVLPPIAGITGAAYLEPSQFSAGFRTVTFIAAGLCVAGGILAGLTLGVRRAGAAGATHTPVHCGLDAPPLHPGRQPHHPGQQKPTSSMGAAFS
jgi:MFS family permease